MVSSIVSIEGLTSRVELNGMKARIVKAHNTERWQVAVLGGPVLAVKSANLVTVPPEWLKETKVFNQTGMLKDFGAPVCSAPVVYLKHLRSIFEPPVQTQVMSFWGGRVYEYMNSKLVGQLEFQRKAGALNYFRGAKALAGMVFSDGAKQTQLEPLTQLSAGGCHFWPVLVTHAYEGVLAVYCQDQALSNARPWLTDSSRVWVFCDGTPRNMFGWSGQMASGPTLPLSTVVIEEVPEEE